MFFQSRFNSSLCSLSQSLPSSCSLNQGLTPYHGLKIKTKLLFMNQGLTSFYMFFKLMSNSFFMFFKAMPNSFSCSLNQGSTPPYVL